MPYELTLQPKPSCSLSKEELHKKLLSLGLRSDPNSVPAGLLNDGFALLEIENDPNSSIGSSITAKFPYCRPLQDVCRELMALNMIALVVDAEVRDGDTIIHLPLGDDSSAEDLAAILIPFCERYNRASYVARRIFGG